MSNTSYKTDRTVETWDELRAVLIERRDEIFAAWKQRIQATSVLQLREDLDIARILHFIHGRESQR